MKKYLLSLIFFLVAGTIAMANGPGSGKRHHRAPHHPHHPHHQKHHGHHHGHK